MEILVNENYFWHRNSEDHQLAELDHEIIRDGMSKNSLNHLKNLETYMMYKLVKLCNIIDNLQDWGNKTETIGPCCHNTAPSPLIWTQFKVDQAARDLEIVAKEANELLKHYQIFIA